MSWRTPLGDRVLEGIEAAFYLSAMQSAVEYLQEMKEIEADLDVRTGDRIFDSATFDQKIVLLKSSLAALLDPTIPSPRHTNVVEASVYFPFAFLRGEIAIEIESDEMEEFDEDEQYRYYYREMVWSAFEEYILPSWQASTEEYGEDEDERNFEPHSNNFELWDDAIDGLLERFFWDRDWMMSIGTPQVLDGIEQSLAEIADLEDYFTTRLPKVTSEQADLAFAAIKNWQLNPSF